ncbi:MAG: hypothetical protein JWR81_2534, partial [Pseudonocardia sp.]|nr:hypothetical protein [Pseudonocardia sp.]
MPPQALRCAVCGAPAARLAAETNIGPNAAWPSPSGRSAPYTGAASLFPGSPAYGSPDAAQARGKYPAQPSPQPHAPQWSAPQWSAPQPYAPQWSATPPRVQQASAGR